MDNDLFVGDDNGYSNGFYFSWINSGTGENQFAPQLMVRPLLWSLDSIASLATVNSSTIGQTMITPSDITVEVPDEDELPYTGLLFYNSTYLSVHKGFADSLGTTIGVVGPASGAEAAQDLVHSIIDSQDPKGWDTQLDNELVFEFSRGRVWRSWVSANEGFDILLDSEARLGTLLSSGELGITFRYGDGLARSYPTLLLSSSRITNPIAVNQGWYIYANIKGGYIFNQIFADGNTYEKSRSIDYDPENIGIGLGFSYAWHDLAITFAINDSSIIEDKSKEQLQDLSRYGTFTISWNH